MNIKLKRISTAVLISSALIVIHPAQKAEASSQSATVNTNILNVRESNSLNSRVIGQLSRGTKVTVYNVNREWSQIEYRGTKRYVATSFLNLSAASVPSSASANSRVYTTTANLNLRSTANPNGNVLLTIPKDREVTYVSTQGAWHRVTFNGRTGFVSSQYIKVQNKPTNSGSALTSNSTNSSAAVSTRTYSTTDNLNLRASASTTGRILTTIPKNKTVTYLSTSGSWHRVKYGSHTGFVSSKYIKVTTNSTSQKPPATAQKPNNVTPTSVTTYTTTANLNMRLAANTSSKVLATIPNKTKLEVLSKQGTWYRVKYKNQIGFVSASFVNSVTTKLDNKPTQTTPPPAKPVTSTIKYKTTANLNLRATNSTAGKVITTIPTGKEVEFISTHGSWLKIKYGSHTGFASSQYLIKVNPPTEQPKPAEPAKPAEPTKPAEPVINYDSPYQAIVTAPTTLNVRSTPEVMNGNVIGSLAKNQIITVTPIVNSKWAKIIYVINGKDTEAFVHLDHVAPYSGLEVPETEAGTKTIIVNYTTYEGSLTSVIDKQISTVPQTDKYRNSPAYVSKSFITPSLDGKTGIVTVNGLNVRAAARADSNTHVYGILNAGRTVQITGEEGGFYTIRYRRAVGEHHRVFDNDWRIPTRSDIENRVDPRKFNENSGEFFQFLDLSKSAGVQADILNRALVNKGTLTGQAQAFIEASRIHNVNEAYLASHAFLETGNGTSTLASGVWVDVNGDLSTSTATRHRLVYNMFGIGAIDSNPTASGAKTAFNNGWFTPEAAIIGGAKWISDRYVNNSRNQNTLYKMRFNPANPGTMQYATDIDWAVKQTRSLNNIYSTMEVYSATFDVPRYLY